MTVAMGLYLQSVPADRVATHVNDRRRSDVILPGSLKRRASWRWLVGFAALIGVANLIVLLAQARALVHSLYLNADHASALVLPALASHAPAGSVVNLGNHPWYEPWWLMRATVGLPGYRQLWEASPFLLGLIGIAVVTACAWWALGRLAGLLCGVALLAASESLRGIVYVPESHGLLVLHAGILCGALLIVYRRALSGRLTRGVLLLVGIPLVVFTGAGLTDQLLFISGLAPFILAPALCWLRSRSQVWLVVSLFALVTSVLSALLALLLTHVMQEQHVVHAPFPIDFVGSEVVLINLQNLIASLASLGGGGFFSAPVRGVNLFTFIAGMLTLVAFAAILRRLWRWSGSTSSSSESLSPQAGLRELFIAYWGLGLLLVLAAFALTSVSGTVGDGRYLIGAWVAAAALLGTLSTVPMARAAMVLGVSLFGVLNLRAELASGVSAFGQGPDQRVAGAIEHFVTAHDASIGYSGYWEAAPVTWETHLRIKIYPIGACSTPTGWCPFPDNQINTWYVPRAHARTFLLTDTQPNVPLEVTAPPASFGRPLAEQVLGEGFTVYIYNHDIAADLGD